MWTAKPVEIDSKRLLDIGACTRCGTMEHMELLDGKLDAEGEATADIECIRCYGPTWAPCGTDSFSLSVAPLLQPLYDAYLASHRT